MVRTLLANAGNAGDMGLVPQLGRFPQRRKWQPSPVFFPGKSHGQRSLMVYRPWGCKESDKAEATEHEHDVILIFNFQKH